MTVRTTIDSPLGELLLVGEESATANGGFAVASLSLADHATPAPPAVPADVRRDADALAEPVRQLADYFRGERRVFDLEYTVTGTAFRQRVWRALEEIPYGTTVTYGEIAERIGAPRAAVRSVGAAIGANPLLVLRPCHRVIGADGTLTGYAAGLERKEWLLTHEGALQPTLV
ncbi:methylated-DNA--[protein]-cysteine S-methyltransferase [Streptomyces sp. PTM05]|uniref:Methylated-DNA--protein-cysteine methyltransferase n=1 Tax=Streptantibioticus parmotrematis TaxID=2873249 RepID=A0ABS7QYJ0_9ACTN|nr:methylated-DNA--[protein]-cysteine S-methyltransferase [Streptantibioticus parmotrematis]MBY8888278.1 methylated-DNA--[protein]-cysteine S-methyltransferase [Streptantibioticus parmotrematis]